MTGSCDIFLSYSREDQARAKLFAEAFEREGFKVWWDVGLRAGEAYDTVTETALKTAKAVVVLWSKRSVESRWVRAEATLADRNKTLVPCMIEPCERPIMFELTQTAELMHWTGDGADAAFQAFLRDVRRFVGEARPVSPVPDSGRAQLDLVSSGPPRLAVLPFTNRSGLAEDDIFADGMVEDLIACLATARRLQVVASGSTAVYRKGTYDIKDVGRRLGVRYLLEGNTRRVGTILRVTAQLVDAELATILWTQRFDRQLSELADLQEDLITEVAAHLGVQIEVLEVDRVVRKACNLSLWEALLRSELALNERRIADAGIFAEKALQLEPENARAHAVMAVVKALGSVTLDLDTSPDDAVSHAERALQLDPKEPAVLAGVATAFYLSGQGERGYACAKLACAKGPGVARMYGVLGHACLATDRIEEAHAAFDVYDRLAPGSIFRATVLVGRVRLHLVEGRIADALTTLQELSILAPADTAAKFEEVIALGLLGRLEEAKQALERYRWQMPSRTLEGTVAMVRQTRLLAANLQAQIESLKRVWMAVAAGGTA